MDAPRLNGENAARHPPSELNEEQREIVERLLAEAEDVIAEFANRDAL